MRTETNTAGLPSKRELINSAGASYMSFRAGLRPRYGLVWLQIGLGYAALMAVLAGCARLQSAGVSGWITVPLGAVAAGYVFAYIHLFIHEAAHFNLAPTKRANDLLSNLFVGLLVGMDIARYRAVHFDHHRFLGTTRDPERSYFDPLDRRFILESLLGVRVLKVMRSRKEARFRQHDSGAGLPSGGKALAVAGAVLNLAVLAGLLASRWHVALVWLGGLGVMFPFFAAVRQVLEHRGEHARGSVDYSRVDHGAVSRLFGDGPLASTLGGAGFNRHMLHHWDPQLSCTRLAEAEAFLRGTAFEPLIRERQTTYLRAFHRLFVQEDRIGSAS